MSECRLLSFAGLSEVISSVVLGEHGRLHRRRHCRYQSAGRLHRPAVDSLMTEFGLDDNSFFRPQQQTTLIALLGLLLGVTLVRLFVFVHAQPARILA